MYEACREGVINVAFYGLSFRGGQGVQAALRRKSAGQEVNGTITEQMWKLRNGLGFAEELTEVMVFRRHAGNIRQGRGGGRVEW